MPYSNEFYQKITTSQVNFSDTPIGSLDVERFLQGKADCWTEPTMVRVIKRKALILADYGVLSWSKDEIRDQMEALRKLLADGFSLYVWKDGQVVPLDKDSLGGLASSYSQKSLKLTPPDEIKLAASSQHKLGHDQIFLLDNYWLQCVYKDDYKPKRSLYTRHLTPYQYIVSDIKLKGFQGWIEEQLSVLNQMKPELRSLIVDKFYAISRPSVPTLSFQTLPQVLSAAIHLETNYVSALLDSKCIRALIENNEYTHDGLTITTSQLTGLESIEMSYVSIDPADLSWILTKTPNLRKLYLWYCNNLSGTLNLEGTDLSNLEEFHLSGSSITAESLTTLLSKATQLKKIDLVHCNLLGTLNLEGADLSNLEEINLSGSSTTAESLATLLSKATRA